MRNNSGNIWYVQVVLDWRKQHKKLYILTKQQTKWRFLPESTYADTYIEEDGDLTFDSQAK
jgi:hypothetical protein